MKMSSEMENNFRCNNFNIFDNKNSSFFVQLSQKFQDCIKTQLNRLSKDVDGQKSGGSLIEAKKESSSSSWEADLEKQMKAWRENPSWEDKPPEMKVSVPKGTLGNINMKVDVGLPPDAVYNIVTDPDNKRVFKNIKEVISRRVLVDEGLRQVVEVEQAAIWRFLWWSGIISVHVLVDQNRADYSMKFKQIKTGFMKRFEGSWKVEPLFVDESNCSPFKPENLADYEACTRGRGRIGSKLSLEQLVQPAILPPPPISWYLRGITARTTEMLINDLLAESARLRHALDAGRPDQVVQTSQDVVKKAPIDDVRDIKERWRGRRRNANPSHRRPVPST